MAFDGTLKFDTAINQAGFKTGLSGLGDLAKSGLSGIGSIAKAGMAAVTGAVTAASGAVLALGKNAVSVGSDFESGMSQVIATMGITKDTVQDGVNSFDLLSQAAKDAGANTTFSATEAAGALNFLALAGYDAATAADSLDAVLNLAAAGSLDLQYAADLATDAMAALGIEASKENLTHFGDQMAVTASKANTSVAQLGEAILTVGGTAKSLSGGVTEMNAALGVLANRGIKGAEGGTALRNMILSLTAPTDKAAAKLDELGVKVLDEAGNMRSLNDVFRDLDKALSTVSDGEKTQILNEIFNKVDLKSAQAMLAGCGDEFMSLSSAIDSCDGAMQKMADTMNDTLEGDMKALNSRAEALGIAVYESINDPLRELAQLGGDYLKQLKDAFDVGGFSGAAYAVGGILGDAVTVLGGYLPDVAGIGNRIVSSLLTGITENSGTIIQTGIDMGLTMLSGFGDIVVNFLDAGAELAKQLDAGVEDSLPRITGTAREIALRIIKALGESFPDILTAGAGITEMLVNSLSEDMPRFTAFGNALIMSVTGALERNAPNLLRMMAYLVESLGGSMLDSLPVLLDCAVQLINTMVGIIADPEALEALAGAAVLIVETLGGALLSNIPVLLEAVVSVLQMLIEGLSDPEALTGLLNTGLVILTTLADILMQNLEPLLGAVIAIIAALGSWLGEHALDLVGAGLSIVQAVVDAVIQNLPLLLDAAVQIIEGLCRGIEEDSDDVLISIEQIIRSLLGFLLSPDTMRMIGDAGGRIIRALIPAAVELAGDLLGFAYDLFTEYGEALLTPDWGEIGKNIVYGILDGLLGVDFDAELFKSDFAENWVSGIKDIFGIHSPSKLMRDEIGKNLALGIEVGFEEHIPDIGDEVETALTDLPTVQPIEVGVDVQQPDKPEPDEPDPVTIPVDYELPDMPDLLEPDDITVSLTDDAARILDELRATQMSVTPVVDPAALEALRMSPTHPASALVPQSATSIVNNSYQYNNSTSTNNSTTTTNQVPESTAPNGDIIIPVQIGGEQIETLVITAAQIANARSGGVTI